MSILFADSNSDLKQEQINLFGIEYINMPFSYDEEGTKPLSVDFYENTFNRRFCRKNARRQSGNRRRFVRLCRGRLFAFYL